MVVFLSIVAVVVSYALGSLNGAVILSRLIYNEDIRRFGSKAPGFFDFSRVYGNNVVSWGVLLFEVLKTVLPVLSFALIFKGAFGMWQTGAQMAGFGCIAGSCFPFWNGFYGNKGLLSGFIVCWFVHVPMALVVTIIFLLLIFLVKYVTIASLAAALICPVSLAIMGASNAAVTVFSILSALLIILLHYPDFMKLLRGKEKKFYVFEKKK